MLADAIRLMLFPALMAFAACSDLLTMTISNRVSLALVAGFFALALVIGMNPALILSHIGAAAAVLVVAFVFFARGWIGGGDAKLAAATALWLGFDHLMTYLLYASLLGGLLTIVLLNVRTMPLPSLLSGPVVGRAPAPPGLRRALRHRAGRGRAAHLSGHDLDEGDRRLDDRPPHERGAHHRSRTVPQPVAPSHCSAGSTSVAIPSRCAINHH